MTASASSALIVAAAAAKARQEEEMTNYTTEDLNNWEFKILRANKIGGFKSPFEFKKAIEEESQNGWQLVEKFDDYRIRFKRKLSDRTNDAKATIDPYRTVYGMSQGAMVALIFAVSMGFVFLVMLLSTMFSGY